MPKKIIHVAQDAIRRNTKEGTNDPAIIIRDYKGATRAHEVDLVLPDGRAIGCMVYRPHDPRPCGARRWIELDTEVCHAVPR